jgi:hypothetical protein
MTDAVLDREDAVCGHVVALSKRGTMQLLVVADDDDDES